MSKRLIYKWGLSGTCLSCLGFIVFASWQELRLFSIDARSGQVQWSQALNATNGEASVPAIYGDKLFLQTIRTDLAGQGWHKVEAYATKTGQRLWERDFYSDYAEKASIYDFSLAVATPQSLVVNLPIKSGDPHNQLVVFDAETGKYELSSERLFGAFSRITRLLNHRQTLWIMAVEKLSKWGGGCDSQTIALKKQDLWLKQSQWEVPLSEQFCHNYSSDFEDLFIANGHSVYFQDGEKIQVRDAKSGDFKFQIAAKPIVRGGLGLTEETFLFGDHRAITAYDAKTGLRKWQSEDICGPQSLIREFTTDAETLYIQCDPEPNNSASSWSGIAAVSINDGQTQWFNPLKTGFAHIPSITSDYVVVIDSGHQRWLANDRTAVTILSKEDGLERSRFPISAETKPQFVATDQSHIYVVDRSPRWRHWLSHWNPNWH